MVSDDLRATMQKINKLWGDVCMKHYVHLRWVLLLLLCVSTRLPIHTVQAADTCSRETGFCIDARIVRYWQTNGGLSVFGHPISAVQERVENGGIIRTQYFERHRIEVHPLAAPYDIQLGHVGSEELRTRYGADPIADTRRTTAGCRWFAETNHAVCGEFATYWQGHGVALDQRNGWSYAENLALLGFPVSGELTETHEGQSLTVQYFERGRLELHPNNPAPYRVLAGLLGRTAQQRNAPVAVAAVENTASPALLPDSVLQTFITNRMPVIGYWQASEHGIYSAVTNIRYLQTFASYPAPDGKRFVAMTVQYRNDREPNKPTEYAGPELYTLVDLQDGVHALDSRYIGLTGFMEGSMVAPGQRTGGQILFLIDKDTAPKQLKVQTNAGMVTIELRVWPIIP